MDDRFEDGGAVRAVEIEIRRGQVRRSDREIADAVVLVAVVAIALGAVVEKLFAARGLGGVGSPVR